MTSNEKFDNNMALARDSLRRAGAQLDRALDEVMQDERKRVLIDQSNYVEPQALKSARSRVKALVKELGRYGLAPPGAVIDWNDVEEVLANGGRVFTLHRQGQSEFAELLNDQQEPVARLFGWRRPDGTIHYSVKTPAED